MTEEHQTEERSTDGLSPDLGLAFQRIAHRLTAFADELGRSLASAAAEPLGLLCEQSLVALAPRLTEWARGVECAAERLQHLLQARNEREKEVLKILAEHNWWADDEWDVFMMCRAAEEIEAGRAQVVDDLLCEWYDKVLDTKQRSLRSRFPTRAPLLDAALFAHKRQEYALSVPVFLIQAEGIWWNQTRQAIYSSKNRPSEKELIEKYNFPLSLLAYLMLFTIPLPINYTSKERDMDFTGLNRNMVLHGEDVDYATRENSCKALSFLCFVASVLDCKRSDAIQEEDLPPDRN